MVVPGFVAGVATGLIVAVIYVRLSAGRGPGRLLQISKDLQAITWGTDNVASMGKAIAALSQVYERELYYYRTRRREASMAKLFRWGAWGVGTIGLLCPLIAPMIAGEGSALEAGVRIAGLAVPLAPLGYFLLALAGALLAANQFLGLTEGHIRFAQTQLELEQHLNALHFGWVELKALAGQNSSGTPDLAAAVKLLTKAREALHRTVKQETDKWASQTAAQDAAHAATFRAGV